MRFQQNFAFKPELAKALNDIKISQGFLFHYTKRFIAKQICDNKEFWITRADCFLDSQEIVHGISILNRIAKKKLGTDKLKVFLSLVKEINNRLASCYILSLSSDEHNKYLAKVYANQETKIKLSEDFPQILANMSWHRISISDSGYSLHYATDIYRAYEGFVEYDPNKKDELASNIIEIFQAMIIRETHFVDQYQLVDLLTQFIIQVKKSKFRKEKEYRISLVRVNEDVQSFEEKRPDGNLYIRLKIPTDFEIIEIDGS